MADYVPLVALAAIPTTMIVVSQIAQGTSQTLSAVGIEGEEAAHRMSLTLGAAGVALTLAAAADAMRTGNPHVVLTTALTSALVVYAYHRISLQGKPFNSPFRVKEQTDDNG